MWQNTFQDAVTGSGLLIVGEFATYTDLVTSVPPASTPVGALALVLSYDISTPTKFRGWKRNTGTDWVRTRSPRFLDSNFQIISNSSPLFNLSFALGAFSASRTLTAPDKSAIIATTSDADDSTLEYLAGVLQEKDGGTTNAKLANMAQALIKGRASGVGAGSPQNLTAAQVRAIILPFAETVGFATDDNPSVTSNLTNTYSAFTRLVYPGTGATFSPNKIEVFLQASAAAPAHSIRLYDVTNAQVIAEITGRSSITMDNVNMGALSNLPVGESVIEFQAKRDAGGAVSLDVFSVKASFY